MLYKFVLGVLRGFGVLMFAALAGMFWYFLFRAITEHTGADTTVAEILLLFALIGSGIAGVVFGDDE